MDTIKTGAFLKALRQANGYTQQDVADKLYLTSKTISKWENGDGLPDISTIQAVADLYKVTVDEILKGERNNQNADNKPALSIQTAKLNEKNGANILANSIIDKFNIYFLVAICIEFVCFLVGIILLILPYGPIGLIIGILGIVFSSLLLIIGDIQTKGNDSQEDNPQVIEKAQILIYQKKHLRKMIFSAASSIEALLIVFAAIPSLGFSNAGLLLLDLLCLLPFITIILIGFFKYDKYKANNKETLINYFYYAFVSLILMTGIFTCNSKLVTKSGAASLGITQKTFLFLLGGDGVPFQFRILGLLMYVIGIGSALLFLKFKKLRFLSIISWLLALASSSMSLLDFNILGKENNTMDFYILPLGFFVIIIGLITYIYTMIITYRKAEPSTLATFSK